ncbi:MAG: enoyl-CoA hydratase/isomerase family protein [Proteobacteria bacterium]|nr:enoyl-CoA hydratase/isomerase family protein [Pseudomonadota bacterium]
MSNAVHFEIEGDVAVIIIDNPPINAGSLDVRHGVLEAIERLGSDAALSAAIIIGGGKTFIAGADLKEFGAPLQDPQLPAVIAAIEACPKPMIAALHGAALGGGYELALGCDARVAVAGTLVGLPEVTLGIIPGAGGTQRLPRLVGLPAAIRMICAGERIEARAALKLGMIDTVVEGDLREGAIAFARQLAGQKTPIRARAVPACDPAELEAASQQALKVGRNRPAVRAAIEAIRNTAHLGMDEGLAIERASFQTLRLSSEARALRHLFFAERDSAKHPALKGVAPLAIARIGVIGAGTMGAGIAISALDAGYQVRLIEREEPALARGLAYIAEYYAGRIAAKKLDAEAATERQARLSGSTDWAVLGDVDLVIEAVFEDIDVKKEVFARLDAVACQGAILASNTSYLDLDAIAHATSRPEDVVGLHFFSPAHVMKLLEVVRGAASSPLALATALEVGKRLRKLPILSANAFGFIGNRIYSAYRRQCEFMIEEGAYPEQVDAALESFGFAMGPFAVADMSGLDIAWRMRKAQAATRDPHARYVQIPDTLCEAGRFGRKTGAGYYRYEPGAKGKTVDPVVLGVIDAASASKGLSRRAIAAEEIQRRALLSMVNEAALLLAEGVCERASDIDLVLINGYGFPRWEGGPVFWARERGLAALKSDLDELEHLSGAGFMRSNPEVLFPREA